MKRLSLVLTLVLALAASGTAASSAAPDSPGAGTADAAQKKKKKKKKTILKGTYTFGDSYILDGKRAFNTVKFSNKGTRISVSYLFFGGSPCERKVTFSNLRLKPTGSTKKAKQVNRAFASKDVALPGDGSRDPDGGGGVTSVRGERLNIRTLSYQFNFSIRMRNIFGPDSTCFQFPSSSGKLAKLQTTRGR